MSQSAAWPPLSATPVLISPIPHQERAEWLALTTDLSTEISPVLSWQCHRVPCSRAGAGSSEVSYCHFTERQRPSSREPLGKARTNSSLSQLPTPTLNPERPQESRLATLSSSSPYRVPWDSLQSKEENPHQTDYRTAEPSHSKQEVDILKYISPWLWSSGTAVSENLTWASLPFP